MLSEEKTWDSSKNRPRSDDSDLQGFGSVVGGNVEENIADARETEPRSDGQLDRRAVVRWGGDERLFAQGFVAVPRAFLRYAPYLELTPSEILFVFALMQHKWDEAPPFPSYERLASMLNCSVNQARKLGRQLEEKGMLRRLTRTDQGGARTSNAFDLTPLFKQLALATEKDANRRFGGRESRKGRA